MRVTASLLFLLAHAWLAAFNWTATAENEPTALVDGVVSAITGEFYHSADDIVVAGAEPITITRSLFAQGWSYLPSEPAAWVAFDSDSENVESTPHLCVLERKGTPLNYGFDKKSLKEGRKSISCKFHVATGQEHRGLTNTARGKISGQTDLKHQYAVMHGKNKSDRQTLGESLSVYAADGSVRNYQGKHHQATRTITTEDSKTGETHYHQMYTRYNYLLEEEELPNGNWLLYSYEHDNNQYRLASIRTMNPAKTKLYAEAKINYHEKIKRFHKNHDQDIVTSDNRTVEYRCERGGEDDDDNPFILLKTINAPGSPKIQLHHHAPHRHREPYLSCISLPQGRELYLDYNDEKKLSSPFQGRVKTLKAPVGNDATPLITHALYYDLNGKNTRVLDAYGNKTQYCWNNDLHLTSLHHYEGEDKRLHEERFIWGSNNSPDATRLLARVFLDGTAHALTAKRFFYDAWGNVTEERVYGNLSGAASPLALDQQGYPVEGSAECYHKKSTYSQEGKHNLLKQEEDNGLTFLFSYFKNTNLMTMKLTCDHERVMLREFWEYNDDHIAIKHIVDDGSSANPQSYEGATYRKITVFTPKRENPYINLLEAIEERYWDGASEVLLSRIEITYTTGGNIACLKYYDASGTFCYALHKEYDDKGRLISETNALGQKSHLRYDKSGNLAEFCGFSGRVTEHLHYDNAGRLIRKEEAGFDGISHTTQIQYDKKNNPIYTLGPQGEETHATYDAENRLIETHLPALPTGERPIIRSQYNPLGKLTAKTQANGETTRTEYTTQGSPTHITHPDGSTESFLYNLDGTLACHTDQEGIETRYIYDVLGRPLTKTLYHQDECLTEESFTYKGGLLTSTTDAEGVTTTYTYDGAGRKIAETCAGETLTYTYDKLGRIATTQAGELIQRNRYDLLNRVVEETAEDPSGEILTRSSYAYDTAGNTILTLTYPNGHESREEMAYDAFNRPTLLRDALGNETHTTYNEHFRNPAGQHVLQKTTTDPLGLQTIETYDTQGHVVLIEKRKEALLSRIQKTYDLVGNLTQEINTILTPHKPNRTTTITREYGPMHRLIRLLEPEGKTTTFSYTAKGLVAATLKPSGTLLTQTYDALDNLSSLTSSDGTISYTYHYDKCHRLLESHDELIHASTLRHYDARGRLLYETLANNLTLTSTYDPLGRRESLTYPDGSSTTYTYDAAFLRLVQRYDTEGTLRYTHAYTAYDLSGNLLEQTLPHQGGTLTYTLDPLGRRETLRSSVHQERITERDAVGNILCLDTDGREHRYAYDSLYQLAQEEGPFHHSYAYDSNHNRIQKDAVTYTLNDLDQLTSEYTYDPNGNPIASRTGFTYTYDALDRLTSVQGPDCNLSFTYDAQHRRLTKTSHGTTQTFLYDGQNEIGSVDNAGALSELRILAAKPKSEIGTAIAFELHGQLALPLYDLFGNVAILLDPATCQPLAVYRYSAFGEERAELSTLASPWRFASKRVDDETGLVYFGRRFYSPELGRWLTPDPAGFTDSLNLYAYVLNNPYTHIDLHGLYSESFGDFMSGLQQTLLPPTPDSEKAWTAARDSWPSSGHEREGAATSSYWKTYTPKGSRITYIKDYDRLTHAKNASQVLHIGLHTDQDSGIFYINGVGVSLEQAIRDAEYISSLAGDQIVHLIYNATSNLMCDIAEAQLNAAGYGTDPVLIGRQMIQEFTHKYPDRNVLIIGHSQGAVIGRNVLLDLEDSVRKRVNFIGFAPAVHVDQNLCKYSWHYQCRRDRIPGFLDPAAAERNKHRTTLLEPHRSWYRLRPTANGLSDWMGHGFPSLTYDRSLKSEIDDFMHGENKQRTR